MTGSYFCLFFARGVCPKGQDCDYLHRLPTIHDMFNPNVDCFGREKFSDYRDDMGGVGSFMRYVVFSLFLQPGLFGLLASS